MAEITLDDLRDLAHASMPHLIHSEVSKMDEVELLKILKRELDDRATEITSLRHQLLHSKNDVSKYKSLFNNLMGTEDY